MAWVVYLTGLPGSGKSTIARALIPLLHQSGNDAVLLRLDDIRKQFAPEANYSLAEREKVYHLLNEKALELYRQGKNVIVDATAYKKQWRDMVRAEVKDFIEVYVKCRLEICIARESHRRDAQVMSEIYRKAIERQKTGKQFPGLGEVVGIDIPYEENEKAEMVIDCDKTESVEAARIISARLSRISP
jgi:adenylylsulfate kinase